jgi:hypothetical protein
MKKCIKCNETKSLKEFEKDRNVCKECRNKARANKPKKKYEVSVEFKLCVCCNQTKQRCEFNLDPSKTDGLTSYCNQCRSTKNKKTYKITAKIKKANAKAYYEKVKGSQEFLKKRRDYQNNKEKVDTFFKIKRRIRNRLYYGVKSKNWKKNTKFSEYIGCDQQTFMSHISTQFTEGMSWDNYGEWHLDHIMPLDASSNVDELYKLAHYTNLRPLWGQDNYIKSNKFTYEVKQIEYKDTLPFILDIHYAHRIPSISYAYGLFRQDILVGICTFGTPFSDGIRKILPNQVLELNRLVLKDNLKNEASRLVAAALKLLPKNKIIISFADPSQGHQGTVYKACNFNYYGLTTKRGDMVIEGRNTHSLTNADLIKNNPDIEYTYEKRTQKHRYITFTGSKAFKKFARDLIEKKYND